jgi:hypothetical protein
MAITVNTTSVDRITPEELLEWALENIDPTDDESMISASERLFALRNNRDFIIEKMEEQMLLLASNHDGEVTGAQATIHASKFGPKGGFGIRSGIWTPPLTSNARSKMVQDKVLSFITPHDHNFSLLTIGYHGPGYQTAIYEYDRDSVVGEPGEPVEISYLETTNLTEGKILYFRACKDIHSQFHPDELSISLNLIGQSPNITSIPQYEFDVENKRIIGLLPGTSVGSLLTPFKIVTCLGGSPNTIDIMGHLARTHELDYVRGAAYQALAKLVPHDFERMISLGMDDKSVLVKNILKLVDKELTD